MSLRLPVIPCTRRIVQAVLYESIAVAIVAPTLWLILGHPPGSSLVLTVLMSLIALAWNYGFNAVFEAWEARQSVKGRSFLRRLVHGAGFEVGLALILVPLMAWWLHLSLLEAFWADAGLIAFFFFYTVTFTWAFDRVFGLPQAAQP